MFVSERLMFGCLSRQTYRILTSRGGVGAVVVEVVEVKRRQRGRDVRIALLPNMLKDVFIAKVSTFN